MATPRVFVSSTAYDLGVLRSSLKGFIESLGFEPILSEYSDVLYDPREHTHSSCIAEVRNCDMVILIVGPRFGGTVIPNVVSGLGRQVDDLLSNAGDHCFSITQAECLAAFQQSIPVFTFVDARVLHDYQVYQHNPGIKITYPSITQPETAEYIFDFINFLQNRSYGNAVISFTRMEEVVDHLKKQWAAYFQRLLRDNRDRKEESRRIDRLSEQFEDLKTALLATVSDNKARRMIQGAIRYRKLIDFMRSMQVAQGNLNQYVEDFDGDWAGFLRSYAGISEIKSAPDDRASPYSAMVREDGTGFMVRMSPAGLSRMGQEWDDFKSEEKEIKTLLFDALTEQNSHSMILVRPLAKEEMERYIADRIDRNHVESNDSSDFPDSDGSGSL